MAHGLEFLEVGFSRSFYIEYRLDGRRGAKTAKSASVIACILHFLMLIFPGAILPLEVMPPIMQKVIGVFPLIQSIQLMKATFLGLPAEKFLTMIIIMAAVMVVCIGIAVKYFRWE